VAGEPGRRRPAVPEARSSAQRPRRRAGAGTGEPAVIVFVFDRLSRMGRDRADKAARIYAEQGHVPGDLVGVFVIDQPCTRCCPSRRTWWRSEPPSIVRHAGAYALQRLARQARAATDRAMDIEEGLAALGKGLGLRGAGRQ